MKKQAIALFLGGAILIQPILPMLSVQAEEKVEINKDVKSEGYKDKIVEKRIHLLNLDKEMLTLKKELEEQSKEVAKREKDLVKRDVELQEREAHLEILWVQHAERIALWQVNGTPEFSFIDFILTSESFADVIGKSLTFKTLLDADNERMDDLKRVTEILKTDKENLKNELTSLKKKKDEVVEKETLLKEKNKKMKKELSELEDKEVKRLQAEILAQEKRKKELLERQLVSQSSTNNTSSNVEELLALASEMGVGVEFDSSFIRPSEGRLTSPFGIRSNPFGTGGVEFHSGIDLANPAGTPIWATAEGVVVKALASNTGYGNYVTIQHNVNGKTFYSVYAHLSVIGVAVGEKVSQGEIVGLMGSTGRSTGPHLHFEIQNENKIAENPELYIGIKDKAKIIKEDKVVESKK